MKFLPLLIDHLYSIIFTIIHHVQLPIDHLVVFELASETIITSYNLQFYTREKTNRAHQIISNIGEYCCQLDRSPVLFCREGKHPPLSFRRLIDTTHN